MCWAWPCNYYGIISWVRKLLLFIIWSFTLLTHFACSSVCLYRQLYTIWLNLGLTRPKVEWSGVEWSGVEVSKYWLCKLHSYQWFGCLKNHFAFSYWQFALKMCVFCIGFFFWVATRPIAKPNDKILTFSIVQVSNPLD
jgi:hypothetical protein